MKLVTVSEMKTIEREANERGHTFDLMMEKAGCGLADIVDNIYRHDRRRGVLGLVGSGNNGGDTLVSLTNLAKRGWLASAYIVKHRVVDDPLILQLKETGSEVFFIENDPGLPSLKKLVSKNRVILDGVLGTGIKLPLHGEIAKILAIVRDLVNTLSDPHIVVAVDCPSGVDCDRGEAAPECIPATLTVTMAAVKAGLMKFPAYSLAGKIMVAGIGLTDEIASWTSIKRIVVDREWVHEKLPPRPDDAHKGTFGTALIVAGSVNYTGAALLAGKAAYLSGVGLVTLAVPGTIHGALAGQFPEATWVLLPDRDGVIAENGSLVLLENIERATAMLIGPGFGLQDSTEQFLFRVFYEKSRKNRDDSSLTDLPPLVMDADGLKLLSKFSEWHHHIQPHTVLTPHPGEMSVLTGIPTAEIQANRLEIAERFAAKWGHILVLKGAFSIVASPDGRTALIPVASAALARAGTGDVLAGLIVGLRAQGIEAYDAAVVGAWIHAQAGLEAAEMTGNTATVLAGDILTGIVKVFKTMASE